MFTDSANAVIFGKGNTLSAFIGSSIIVWPVHILIARGVKEAAAVNLVATFVKVFPLVLFIGLAIYFFSPHTFTQDMAGASLNHSVGEQVKNTMLITLWVFTGLEGASVLSAHAKKKSDVGLATVLGIVIALGRHHRALPRHFAARGHRRHVEPVHGGLIGKHDGWQRQSDYHALFDYLGARLLHQLDHVSTEVPYRGAKNGVFPKILDKLNRNDTPINSL